MPKPSEFAHDAEPLVTAKQVDNYFADGAETVTLTKYEWDSIQKIQQTYHANLKQVHTAEEETARIRKICLPLGGRASVFRTRSVSVARRRQSTSS